MKPLYEVFDEFEKCKNKKDRMGVIGNNLSQTLVDVLKLTFHPNFRWKVTDLPDNYRIPCPRTIEWLHHPLFRPLLLH